MSSHVRQYLKSNLWPSCFVEKQFKQSAKTEWEMLNTHTILNSFNEHSFLSCEVLNTSRIFSRLIFNNSIQFKTKFDI